MEAVTIDEYCHTNISSILNYLDLQCWGGGGIHELILHAVEHLVVPVTRPNAGGAVERLGRDSERLTDGTLGGLSSFSPPVPCRFHAFSCLGVEIGKPAVRSGDRGMVQ